MNQESDVLKQIVAMVREANVDAVVAGPAFNSGRYGLACGAVCAKVQTDLGMPAVTAMHRENPGVDLYRRSVVIASAGVNPVGMGQTLETVARLLKKLVNGEPLGLPTHEGYISRQIRIPERVATPAGERAIRLALARIHGEPFESEYVLEAFEPIQSPPPVSLEELRKSVVALVFECGIVPTGNPDRLESWKARKWFTYPLPEAGGLRCGGYQSVHAGYNTEFVNADPNRAAGRRSSRPRAAGGIRIAP